MIMTNEQKKQVREALIRYTANFDTQTQAAERLQGISASTISQVKNNNWELLSERLWHHIARQVGFYCGEWQPADTSGYLLLRILFSDAQHYNMAYGVSMETGLGKTFTAGQYTREQEHVYYMAGNADYNRKSFMALLLHSAGLDASGTVPELMARFADHVAAVETPLVIIDDAHKLKDRVLHMLVLLANSLVGKAGIIIMGGPELRMRIVEGVRLKKVGFDEIYKSIGRRFITLTTLALKDVEVVCRANGVHDDDIIEYITAECGNSLHAASRLIHQYTQMNIAA